MRNWSFGSSAANLSCPAYPSPLRKLRGAEQCRFVSSGEIFLPPTYSQMSPAKRQFACWVVNMRVAIFYGGKLEPATPALGQKRKFSDPTLFFCPPRIFSHDKVVSDSQARFEQKNEVAALLGSLFYMRGDALLGKFRLLGRKI